MAWLQDSSTAQAAVRARGFILTEDSDTWKQSDVMTYCVQDISS